MKRGAGATAQNTGARCFDSRPQSTHRAGLHVRRALCAGGGGPRRPGAMTQAELLAELHIAVVIPAYEAASTIGAVLEAMPSEVRLVVVVDDGSSDGTADVVGPCITGDARWMLQ